jgi:hypothetical protein
VALAWFICPYKRDPRTDKVARYCAMGDFNDLIVADGGRWSEAEILGDAALVKVSASAGTLTTINAAPGFLRFPNHVDLNDTLGDLTANQRQALRDEALALGYTQAEIDAALPANWATVTLRQVLNFFRTRRLRPRYDAGTDTIVLDGAVQACKAVEVVDSEVS